MKSGCTLVLLLLTGIVHGTIPVSERATLDSLYTNTVGPTWYNGVKGSDAWEGPAGSECGWFGITCEMDAVDPTIDHIVSVFLNDNNLGGTLPDLSGLRHP